MELLTAAATTREAMETMEIAKGIVVVPLLLLLRIQGVYSLVKLLALFCKPPREKSQCNLEFVHGGPPLHAIGNPQHRQCPRQKRERCCASAKPSRLVWRNKKHGNQNIARIITSLLFISHTLVR